MLKPRMSIHAHRLLCEIAAYARRYKVPANDLYRVANCASDVMDGKYKWYDRKVKDALEAGVLKPVGNTWVLTDLGCELVRPQYEEKPCAT